VAKNKTKLGRRTLAEHIRAAATGSGESIYQIARNSGVDQSTLNKFMNGTRTNLTLEVADKLFEYLGLEVVERTD